jgi:hypothetical protein
MGIYIGIYDVERIYTKGHQNGDLLIPLIEFLCFYESAGRDNRRTVLIDELICGLSCQPTLVSIAVTIVLLVIVQVEIDSDS